MTFVLAVAYFVIVYGPGLLAVYATSYVWKQYLDYRRDRKQAQRG